MDAKNNIEDCDVVRVVLDRIGELLRREPTPGRWLSVAHAALWADLSPESIRRLIDRDELTAHRPIKGRVLIDRHELDRLILGSTNRPTNGRGMRSPR